MTAGFGRFPGALAEGRSGGTLDPDMAVARRMQELMLPSRETRGAIRRDFGVAVEAQFRPWSDLGGDFWYLRPLDRKRFVVALADFSGHGLAAALNTFRLHALITDHPIDAEDPAACLNWLNLRLIALLPRFQFATCFLGVIDTRAETLTYAAAAAPAPLLMAGEPLLLDGSGLPLGVSRHASYQNRRAPFTKGASLLLYSDALTETPDSDGFCLDGEALSQMARQSRRPVGRETPLDDLLARFAARHGPLEDDLTMIWLADMASFGEAVRYAD